MAQTTTISRKKNLTTIRPVWERISSLMKNDEEEFTKDIFCRRLPQETLKAYEYRQKMFSVGFVNPTIELITAPGSLIYSNEIREEVEDTTGRLSMFMGNVSRSTTDPLPLKLFMRESVCPSLRAYGTVFILLDMPPLNGAETEQQQRDTRVWPYVTLLDPLSILNYEMYRGDFLWFAYTVVNADTWADPLSPAPKEELETRIWTREKYIVKVGDTVKTEMDNPFGFVPVIVQASFKPEPDCLLGVAPFFSSSNSIISANNHLNVVNMEIWKHAGALLLMPKSALGAANTDVDNSGQYHIKTLADDGALIYEGEKEPGFLTRDLDVIEHAHKQYLEYMRSAFENEKNAKSVGKLGYGGDDVSDSASGFAKVIDREPMQANIIATAIDMQNIHRKILKMAQQMLRGRSVPASASSGITVEYDMEYDVTPFATLLDNAQKVLTEVRIPSVTTRKVLLKRIAAKIIDDPIERATAFEEIDAADVMNERSIDDDLNRIIAGSSQGSSEEREGEDNG